MELAELPEVKIVVKDTTKQIVFAWLDKEFPVNSDHVVIEDFYGKGQHANVQFIREGELERKGE